MMTHEVDKVLRAIGKGEIHECAGLLLAGIVLHQPNMKPGEEVVDAARNYVSAHDISWRSITATDAGDIIMAGDCGEHVTIGMHPTVTVEATP